MDITKPLPTTSSAVDAYLRDLANPRHLEQVREMGASEYPYLYGMATVKLAEANAELARLRKEQQ